MVLRFTILLAAALPVLVVSAQPSYAFLVGHYTFDDPANLFADDSGNGNDGGTLTGAPVQNTANPKVGVGALSVDGNDAGQINAIADDVPTTPHSLAAWINTTATNRPCFLAANTPAGQNSNLLFITGGANATAQVHSDPPNSFIAVAPAPVVNDGAWHHVVWTRSGNTGNLYVDGLLRDTATNANYVRTATDRWSIGQEFDGGSMSDFWNGLIDDVQIYDTALADWQVAAMFGSPGSVAPVPEPSTLLIWSLLAALGLAAGWRRQSK
jgi:hypothetical protein